MPSKTGEPLAWEWWGSDVPYADAHARQAARREAVIAGRGGECLALLEHRAVVTVGRRPAPGTPPPEVLAAAGLDHHRTERGGLATWHGPGQLVGYLVLDVRSRGWGAKALVRRVEQGLITWLAARGVSGDRRCGFPGVWVGGDKIAAVGFHFRRGVSMHGFALNLSPDLSGYAHIVPCGITDGGVTTLAHRAGQAPPTQAAAPSVAAAILGALGQLDATGCVVRVPPRSTAIAGA